MGSSGTRLTPTGTASGCCPSLAWPRRSASLNTTPTIPNRQGRKAREYEYNEGRSLSDRPSFFEVFLCRLIPSKCAHWKRHEERRSLALPQNAPFYPRNAPFCTRYCTESDTNQPHLHQSRAREFFQHRERC